MNTWTRTAFVGIFLATGCTVAVEEPARDAPGAPTPPSAPAAPATTARRVWLVTAGEPAVPIHDVRILGADGVPLAAARDNGCDALSDIVTGGGPGGSPKRLAVETGAAVPASFLDAVARDVSAASAAVGGVRVAVGDLNGDGIDCVVPVPAASLTKAKLTTRKAGGAEEARVVWELVAGGPLVVEPRAPDGAGMPLDLDSPVPATTAGLLLPAVQKVREAAMTESADDGLALFGGPAAPTPFDVPLPAGEDADDEGRSAIGLVQLRGGGRAFALTYEMTTARVSPERVRVTPGKRLGLVRSDLAGASEPSISGLGAEAPATLVTSELERLLAALDGQPSLSGEPMQAHLALKTYWTSSAGTLPSFANGLSTFLGRASNEEGFWAYTRLVTAHRVFAGLDPAEGRRPEGMTADDIVTSRLLVAAATLDSKTASFAMLPGGLLSAPERAGHDYRLALAATHRLAAAGPLLVSSLPHQLVGVEPDEIDVAVASGKQGTPEVRSVDSAAKRYTAKRDEVLADAAPTATQLSELAAETAKLRGALAALGTVTEARFAVTR